MAKVGCHVAEQFQTGRVGPVEILQEHEDRTGGTELGEEPANVRKEGRLVSDALQDTPGEGGRRGWQRGIARIGSRQIEPGSIRWRVRQVVAMAAQHARAAGTRFPSEIPRESGLADAGFATQKHQASMTREGRGQLFA